jgi:hypothetical protein
VPIPAGINVSKANLYAVLSPGAVIPAGINVSKANVYAVLAPAPPPPPPVPITLAGLRVILRGVKRVRKGQEAEVCNCPEPEHVNRAV